MRRGDIRSLEEQEGRRHRLLVDRERCAGRGPIVDHNLHRAHGVIERRQHIDLIFGANGAGDRAAAIKVDVGRLAVDGGAGAFEQRRHAAGGEFRRIAPDDAAGGRAQGRDVGTLDFDPGVLRDIASSAGGVHRGDNAAGASRCRGDTAQQVAGFVVGVIDRAGRAVVDAREASGGIVGVVHRRRDDELAGQQEGDESFVHGFSPMMLYWPMGVSEALPLLTSEPLPLLTSEPLPLLTSEALPLLTSEALPLLTSEALPLLTSEALPLLTSEALPLLTSEPPSLEMTEPFLCEDR